MTVDLVAFLRAQLDADEQTARAATPGPWRADADGASGYFYGGEDGYDISAGPENEIGAVARGGPAEDGGPDVGACSREDAEHIARHDPAFTLADITAKRAILDTPPYRYEDGAASDSAWDEWARVVRLLAQPYAGRPGWHNEWTTT